MQTEKLVFNKLFKKEELASVKVELADNVMTLLTKAEDGKKQALAAKIAINEFKVMSKKVADLVDNFGNGPYFDVVIKGKDTIKAAKDLGLGDSPEIQRLIAAGEVLSKYRNELKNGSDWLIK